MSPPDQQIYTASQYEFWSFPDIRRNSPSPYLKTEDAPTRWLNGEISHFSTFLSCFFLIQQNHSVTRFISSACAEADFVGSALVRESSASSAGDDDKIYFFFTEKSQEQSTTYSHSRVARVGRICKVSADYTGDAFRQVSLCEAFRYRNKWGPGWELNVEQNLDVIKEAHCVAGELIAESVVLTVRREDGYRCDRLFSILCCLTHEWLSPPPKGIMTSNSQLYADITLFVSFAVLKWKKLTMCLWESREMSFFFWILMRCLEVLGVTSAACHKKTQQHDSCWHEWMSCHSSHLQWWIISARGYNFVLMFIFFSSYFHSSVLLFCRYFVSAVSPLTESLPQRLRWILCVTTCYPSISWITEEIFSIQSNHDGSQANWPQLQKCL